MVCACGTKAPAPADREPEAEALDSLRAIVEQLVAEPVCNEASQCRTAAFGAKPCGGPWSYLVYSTQTTDSATLAAAVARYNAREAQMNRESGRMSDCRSITPPELDCANSRCVAAQ